MASVKNLKKDLNNIIGEIIQNVNLWQLENLDVDLKKSEKLIDECFDAFDAFIKKIHNKDVKDKNKYYKALNLELANVASDLVKKFNSL
jgi:chitinase